jgi:hypothetical protein
MSAWSHLPNAVHIVRVLALIKSHPKLWDQVWKQARDQAWYQARVQVWKQAREQAWEQAREQVWQQAWYQARDQAIRQVTGPLLALIAYDDCAKYLDLPIDQLQMLYHLTEHPACILLQPAVVAFAMEGELA